MIKQVPHPRKYCVEKSLKIAKELFPQDYCRRKKYRTFHYAFGFIGKELVGIGLNQPDIPNAKALYFGKRFGVEQFKKYSYLHAEIALLSKFWGKFHIDENLSIYLVRLNKNGEEQNSKPCKSCQTVLNALGVSEVFWTPFLK